MPYSMEHPFGQCKSVVSAMLPHNFLWTSSLSEHETVKSPWLQVRTTEQQLEYEYQQYSYSKSKPHSIIPVSY